MSLELITAVGRWLLPVLAALIVVSCGGVLLRGNRKTGTIGYVVNAANGDSMALRSFETSIGRSKLLRGRAVDPQEVVEKIEAVSKEDVLRVIERVFTKPCAASVVGRNIDELKIL